MKLKNPPEADLEEQHHLRLGMLTRTAARHNLLAMTIGVEVQTRMAVVIPITPQSTGPARKEQNTLHPINTETRV